MKKFLLTGFICFIMVLTLSSSVLAKTSETNVHFQVFRWHEVNSSQKVDAFSPQITSLPKYIRVKEVAGTVLYDNKGKQILANFEYDGNSIKILANEELSINTSYQIRIFMEDGKRFKVNFNTGGLPALAIGAERQIIKIPAMPEKGFNWPYLLAIPSNRYLAENKDFKKYLMVDIANSGPTSVFEQCLNDTKNVLTEMWWDSTRVAEEMSTPMIMPVFPRPSVGYYYDNEWNDFYTHALDRDTATLHEKIKDSRLSNILQKEFEKTNFKLKDFIRLDNQLSAMIDHAVSYLNQYGFNMEQKKAFFNGYSASGQFVDRYVALNPDRVKAYAAGAANDDMVLPLANYKGKDLIFPIGVSDFKVITGKDFNMAAHNNLARLVYMGKDDDNNVLPYSDCYGDKEREIITSLWGVDVLPRAQAAMKLYGESGGKGMFILDKDIKHGSSQDMNQYLREFFKANRNSSTPVYPIPKNPDQLQYTLFK